MLVLGQLCYCYINNIDKRRKAKSKKKKIIITASDKSRIMYSLT